VTTTDLDTTTAAGIIRLGNSFCDAKALLTAVELDLFGTLAAGPATEEEIRQRLDLNGRGLRDWLDLLVCLGLLTVNDGRYGNGEGAQRHLVRGGPGFIGGFLARSNNNLYPAWGRLGTALRTGEQQSGSDFGSVLENPAILRQFINSMDGLIRVLGPQLIAAYDGWPDYKSVLDVGGCRGCMVAQIIQAYPHLTGVVMDLPQMAPFFDELASEEGLAGKVTFQGGDFFTDSLPSADIVMIGHVLHDWDRRQRGELIAKSFAAVNPGGVLLVYDRMLDRAESRVENLVISLDMLLVTDGGSEYTVAEVNEHARGVGATAVTDHVLGDYDTLVVCHKAV
jgi:SAM-dependent methyltransferase